MRIYITVMAYPGAGDVAVMNTVQKVASLDIPDSLPRVPDFANVVECLIEGVINDYQKQIMAALPDKES